MTSISKIIIGGFKSIRERTEIPIAPITFLFGPNSAGKSAVHAAMDALIERLREPNSTRLQALLGGGAPPVFSNSRNFLKPASIIEGDSVPVYLGVQIEDFASNGPDFPDFPDSPIDGQTLGRALYWALDGSAVGVEIAEDYSSEHVVRATVSYLSVDQVELFQFASPQVSSNIGLQHTLQFKGNLNSTSQKDSTWCPLGCLTVNLKHPIWSLERIEDSAVDLERVADHALSSDSDRKYLALMLREIAEEAASVESEFINQVLQITAEGNELIIRTNVAVLDADQWHPAVFSLGGLENTDFRYLWNHAGLDIRMEEKNFPLIRKVNVLLAAFSLLFKSVKSSVEGSLQLPEVKGDRQTLTPDDVTTESHQEKVPYFGHHYGRNSSDDSCLKVYAYWLGITSARPASIHLDIFEKLKGREDFVNFSLKAGLFGAKSYQVKPKVKALTSNTLLRSNRDTEDDDGVSYRVQLFLEDSSGRHLDFHEVGSGISYVVPILASLMWSEAAWIAQPELHLHPSAQCELGDVFLRAFNRGHYAVVETHSEHMLLRVLKRIRQTTNGAAIDADLRCPPEAVSVLYFDPQEDGSTKVKQLRVTRLGDFKDRWPDGFFEERGKELFDE